MSVILYKPGIYLCWAPSYTQSGGKPCFVYVFDDHHVILFCYKWFFSVANLAVLYISRSLRMFLVRQRFPCFLPHGGCSRNLFDNLRRNWER